MLIALTMDLFCLKRVAIRKKLGTKRFGLSTIGNRVTPTSSPRVHCAVGRTPVRG